MNWIKRNGKAFILLSIIGCFIAPIIINVILSYNLIPSIGTNSGEWLGFWGSFLGSIIGGGATLVGVLLTIAKMEEDEKKRKMGEEPFLIPLRKDLTVYRDNRENIYYFHNKFVKNNVDELIKDYEVIDINLINSGKNCALSISGSWRAPRSQKIFNYFSKNKIKNNYLKYFTELDNSIVHECKNLNIQIIMPLQSSLDEGGIISGELRTYIKNVVDCIINSNKEKNGTISYKDIPLGVLVLKYNDVYGLESLSKRYIMEMRLLGSASQNKEEYNHYILVIEFKLIEDNKHIFRRK